MIKPQDKSWKEKAIQNPIIAFGSTPIQFPLIISLLYYS